jgi:4a-hydroxytetrahydrobiopterin dehydratase
MEPLRNKNCLVCVEGGKPLKGLALMEFKKQIDPSWEIVDDHHLKKEFNFKNFMAGLKFINLIATVAEQEGHHPDVKLSYTKVQIELFSHKVKGLTESDFILADKNDSVYGGLS